jgi:hypothetical protein
MRHSIEIGLGNPNAGHLPAEEKSMGCTVLPRRRALRPVLAALCSLALLATVVHAQPQVTTVMTGLDNPRGLALGPEGGLYVAEAGRGGDGPCLVNLVGELRCFGLTGAISRLWKGVQQRIVSGLPSNALPDGTSAAGPSDISFQGRGGMFVLLSTGAVHPADRPAFGPHGWMFGTLFQQPPGGPLRVVADVAAFEVDANPDGGPIDSNPYGLLAQPGGRLVVDAGGNSLLTVAPTGRISTLATFPSRPQGRSTDSVPTAVTVGPDGAYYVSELTGVPFAANAARIYRVVPGREPEVYLDGFTTILDLEFGPDGSLYVLQHSTGPMFFALPGSLLRVAPDGTRTTVVSGLERPTSVVVDWDGTIYLSIRGIHVGTGEVLKIVP